MPRSHNISAISHLRFGIFEGNLFFIMCRRPRFHEILKDNYIFPSKLTSELVVPLESHDDISIKTDNGSWTGVIGLLQRGEADLAVLPVIIDEEKVKDVDFSNIQLPNDLSIASKIEGKMFDADIMDDLLTADWRVWILSLISMISVILFINLVENRRTSFSNIVHLYVSYLLCQGSPSSLPSLKTRIVAAFFFWFLLFFNTSVFAFLKTNLVAMDIEKFDSLNELIHQDKVKPMIIGNGGDIRDAFRLSNKEEYKELMTKIRKGKGGFLDFNGLLETIIEGYEMLAQGKHAWIGERSVVYSVAYSEFCPDYNDVIIHVVDEPLSGTMFGFPITKQKGSEFRDTINYYSRRAHETGIGNFDFQVMIGGTPSCFEEFSADADVNDVQPLKIGGFRKVFYFLMIGLGVSFIVFLAECYDAFKKETDEGQTALVTKTL